MKFIIFDLDDTLLCGDCEKEWIKLLALKGMFIDADHISILEKFLPEQLSEEEILQEVNQAIAESGAESMQDMGKVMGLLKNKLSGKADMGLVSIKVKESLG